MSRPGAPVDAILVTYRRTEPLIASCRAALAQSVALRTLVVVDNSPEPVAAEALGELVSEPGSGATSVEILCPGTNLGPPGAHDAGFAHLRHRGGEPGWVLLLDDDDPLPSSDVVARLLAALPQRDSARIGGVALMGMRFVRPNLLLGGPVDIDQGGLVPADGLLGWAAPIYRASALEDVGGFRPELFWGDDDIELGLRLKSAGWRLLVAADVYRSLGRSFAKVPGTPRLRIVRPSPRDYYSLRNRIHIGMRHFPRRSVVGAIAVRAIAKPLCNLPLHPALATRTLTLNARAVRDGLRGRLGRRIPLGGETRADRDGSST